MATHSSILAWGIPWTEDPGELQFMGSQSRTQQGIKHLKYHIGFVSPPDRGLKKTRKHYDTIKEMVCEAKRLQKLQPDYQLHQHALLGLNGWSLPYSECGMYMAVSFFFRIAQVRVLHCSPFVKTHPFAV